MTKPRFLVYADTDLNLIDGSAIWTQSVALALANTGEVDVTLLLKAPIEEDRLVRPLLEHPAIRVVDPFMPALLQNLSKSLSPYQVQQILEGDALGPPPDRVLIRGQRIARQLVEFPMVRGKLWTYLTDIPHTMAAVSRADASFVANVADASEVLLAQTESLRSLFEQLAPGAVGKTFLLPPVVPAPSVVRPEGPARQPLSMVYAGKFAPDWNTLEMTELPARLEGLGVRSALTMIGDKIHRPPEDPEFYDAMGDALRHAPGVRWSGGMAREDAMAETARHDVGLSWRSQALTDSRELSTKVLEYCAVGLPVILNRNGIHERLLGEDYALFAESIDEVAARLKHLIDRPGRYARAAEVCRGAVGGFMMDAAVVRLRRLVDRFFPYRRVSAPTAQKRVLVMSHDFKFFTQIQNELELDPALEVAVDAWPGLNEHDPEESLALMDNADVIICEWCGPNAAFASQNKKSGQRLIVRLHRFELYGRYPRNVLFDAVDSMVTVSPHYRDLTVERTGWDSSRVVVIPNWVDDEQLDRHKVGPVDFQLGFIGLAPMRKRFDTALDILSTLRRRDPRYHLFVKSKHAWEYPWIWSNADERRHYVEAFRRLRSDADLAGAVTFDGFGPDVPHWLQKIGYVLSTSDDESFHLAPAEGIASGAVPVIINWPGAETIYSPQWIHESAEAMAEFIWESRPKRASLADEAASDIEPYRRRVVLDAWSRLVNGVD